MSIRLVPVSGFDAFLIQSTMHSDSRGSMQRIWENLDSFNYLQIREISWVSNPRRYTLRGLHFQTGISAETKVIFCTSGTVFDVGVDLRKDSPTYLKYFAVEIGPYSKYQGVLMPKGFAHGYLTLRRNSKLVYLMDQQYDKQNSSGVLWSDETLKISWPKKPRVLSNKDKSWPVISI